MNKLFLVLFLITSAILLFAFINKNGNPSSSIHQFKAKTLEGEYFDFTQLKGKKVLIVNTASKCGFTPQYKELEALYQQYKDKNFTIIGFPCNQFGAQEPGTSSEIHDFCTKNYGVTFLMMEKVNVKGDSICDIYKWLTNKSQNGVMSSSVKWNFQKYMIDENGFLVDYVLSFKSPLNSKITKWIEGKN
ncbi:MAG: glutathione peroxidase [Bacteroidia bacterium]